MRSLEKGFHHIVITFPKEVREKMGYCGNCGRTGHKTSNCPRPCVLSTSSVGGAVTKTMLPTPGGKGCKGGKAYSGTCAVCTVYGRRYNRTLQ